MSICGFVKCFEIPNIKFDSGRAFKGPFEAGTVLYFNMCLPV